MQGKPKACGANTTFAPVAAHPWDAKIRSGFQVLLRAGGVGGDGIRVTASGGLPSPGPQGLPTQAACSWRPDPPTMQVCPCLPACWSSPHSQSEGIASGEQAPCWPQGCGRLAAGHSSPEWHPPTFSLHRPASQMDQACTQLFPNTEKFLTFGNREGTFPDGALGPGSGWSHLLSHRPGLALPLCPGVGVGGESRH